MQDGHQVTVLKIDQNTFCQILDDVRRFLYMIDNVFEVGNYLVLQEYYDNVLKLSGRNLVTEVTCIERGNLPDEHCILGIRVL